MTSIFQSPGPASDDLVVTTVDEEIRREALRLVESIDCDDDDWRIELLPTFSDAESGDDTAGAAVVGLQTSEEANRRNN